jgi:hypothetical protein
MYKCIFILAIVAFSLLGCKSTKVLESGKAKHISEGKLIDNVIENQLQYDRLFIKRFDGSVDFDGNKFTFKAAMYIVKDSQIVISVMPLMGIELFKVLITPTELVVIDKTKKRVMYGEVDYLTQKFNVPFGYDAIQAMFTNSSEAVVCNDDLAACLKAFKYDVLRDGYSLTSQSDRRNRQVANVRNVVQLFYVPDIFRLGKVSLKDTRREGELSVHYSQFSKFGQVLFPKNVVMVGASGGKEARFTMSIDLLEVNGSNGISFKVPDKYEKISLNK